MAGIAFELKKLLKKQKLFSLLVAYGYSAVLISGPWVISIISILLVGYFAYSQQDNLFILQFQSLVTYLLALSLILTGSFQLSFVRSIADFIFQKREEQVFPNLMGALLLSFGLGIIGAFIGIGLFLNSLDLTIKILILFSFIALCGIWIVNVLFSGLKEYKKLLLLYFVSFASIFVFSFYFKKYGLSGLLFSFLLGLSILLYFSLILIGSNFVLNNFISFDFLQKDNFYLTYALIGLFYNLGIWIDKFMFWFSRDTGRVVIGGLKNSILYDLPIFLAYLSIVPGMSVLFYRLEVDFAEKYEKFYDAVREKGTLEEIFYYKKKMIRSIRMAIREIMIVQGIFTLILFLTSEDIFSLLNIPKLYLPLFYVDLVGAQLQLGFTFCLSFLFYLDKIIICLIMSILFFVLNFIFTYLSIKLGPYFYGYGFSCSLLVCFVLILFLLSKVMEDLEYETFAFQEY